MENLQGIYYELGILPGIHVVKFCEVENLQGIHSGLGIVPGIHVVWCGDLGKSYRIV